jgi:hypothetical protein
MVDSSGFLVLEWASGGRRVIWAWGTLLALAGIAAFAVFTKALNRWPVVGSVAVATNVLIAWEVPYPKALANVGGNSVYFLDVLAAAFLVIGVSGFRHLSRNVGPASLAWVGLGILLLTSLGRGLTDNSFGSTMNEFRSFLYPYATLTWAMSLKWKSQRTNLLIRKAGLVLGWALAIVAAYHAVLYGFGSASGFVDAGTGLEQTTRPLVSGQALVLLMCAMVCVWYWRRLKQSSLLVSAVVFLLVVVIAQQRTVWAVALAAVAVVFLSSRAGTKTRIVAFGLVAAWLGAFILEARIAPELLTHLGESVSDSGTYNARVRSWLNLIDQSVASGYGNVIFGQPMGTGFGRFEGVGRWVEFAPHNWYVTIYLRVGVLGLLLLAVFLVTTLIGALRRRSNMAGTAILIAVIVYGWSYSWPWYVGIFFGWAVTASTSQQGQLKKTGPKVVTVFPDDRLELRPNERQ